MIEHIRISAGPERFLEDKDLARQIRNNLILPALDAGIRVQLDFEGVDYATQSFVHALVGEALKKFGEPALERIEFQNCSSQLRSIIELVVSYSLAGFQQGAGDMTPEVISAPDSGSPTKRGISKRRSSA